METSLHRGLKEHFAARSGAGGRLEVAQAGFRIDAIDAEGVLIEVQSGPLSPLRPKLARLLADPATRVRVVKPVVIRRRVVRRSSAGGPDLSARMSPRVGSLLDVFDDLVGLAKLFPTAGLRVDVLGVLIDEIRVPTRRRPGYRVVDRVLREVLSTVTLEDAVDLWALIPPDLPDPFTTRDLALHLRRSPALAQRVAYCLRHSGAAETVGKSGPFALYRRPD